MTFSEQDEISLAMFPGGHIISNPYKIAAEKKVLSIAYEITKEEMAKLPATDAPMNIPAPVLLVTAAAMTIIKNPEVSRRGLMGLVT